MTSVLFPFIEVSRESKRVSAQRYKCYNACTYYRREDKCTDRRGDTTRPIRSTVPRCARSSEKMFKRYGTTFSYRFWHRLADSLAAGWRETNGLYFAELSLPRTILISRLPIKALFEDDPFSPHGRRQPNYMDHCRSLWRGSKTTWGCSPSRICVFISDPRCFSRTR